MGYSVFLAVERIFSIALVTIKFFPDFNPRTGFSFTSGTLGFLKELSYEKLRTLLKI